MPFFIVRFALLIYLWLGRLAIAHRSCVSISLEIFLSLLCFHAFSMLSVCSSSFDLEFIVTELNLFGQFSLFLLVWLMIPFPSWLPRHLFNNYSLLHTSFDHCGVRCNQDLGTWT